MSLFMLGGVDELVEPDGVALSVVLDELGEVDEFVEPEELGDAVVELSCVVVDVVLCIGFV